MKHTLLAGIFRSYLTPAVLALGLAACGDTSSPASGTGTAAGSKPAPAPALAGAEQVPEQVPEARPLQKPTLDEHGHDASFHDHGGAGHEHDDAEQELVLAEDGADALLNSRSKDKPRLDVDSNEHDFGNAIEGERLTHTFKLKSTGGADLVINTAKPTCGCTVAKVAVIQEDGESVTYEYGEPLAPGTELELTARLDTKNKHNVASSKINIFCNDPRQTITLGLKTTVDTYFQITPGSLAFGELSVNEVAEQSFVVTGKKPGAFLLSTEGRTTPPGLAVELAPENPDENGRAERWNVKVTLGPDSREGNLGYPIQLRSDEEVAGAQKLKGGDVPTYGATVMVTARIRGLIAWEPQYLSFGLVRPGQVVARSFQVTSFAPDFSFGSPTVRIIGPNDQKPEFEWAEYFTATSRPSEDGQQIQVELTLTGLPSEAQGSFQGRLMLETGHPAKPEIPVLFSGVCRPGVSSGN